MQITNNNGYWMIYNKKFDKLYIDRFLDLVLYRALLDVRQYTFKKI